MAVCDKEVIRDNNRKCIVVRVLTTDIKTVYTKLVVVVCDKEVIRDHRKCMLAGVLPTDNEQTCIIYAQPTSMHRYGGLVVKASAS